MPAELLFYRKVPSSKQSFPTKQTKKEWHSVNLNKRVYAMFAGGVNYFVIEVIIKLEE